MFVTIVQAEVAAEREADLRAGWEQLGAGLTPEGLVESSLLRADNGLWQVVTVWESREAVTAARSRGERPAALELFQNVDARPLVSLWNVEGHIR